MILSMFFAILSTFSGQLGPNYDPLFYDVMIYIFSGIFLLVFIIVVIVYLIVRRKNKKKYFKSRNNFSDDSDKKNWD